MNMRIFFQEQLEALERNTGLKQYEKILERDDWEREVKELKDVLCRACIPFDHIPNEDKQRAIQAAILKPDFRGFSARFITEVLSQVKKVSIEQEAESKPDAPVLTGPEREAWLKKWMASLGDGMHKVPDLSEAEIKTQGRIEVEKKGTGYVPDRVFNPAEYELIEKIRKVAAEKYEGVYDFSKFKRYPVKEVEVFALTKEDAEHIYRVAKERMNQK